MRLSKFAMILLFSCIGLNTVVAASTHLWLKKSEPIAFHSTDTNRVQSLLRSANSALKKGVQLRAIDFAKEAHLLAPDNALVNLTLGIAYLEAWQYADAEPFLIRAVELAPTLVEAKMKLATVQLRLGKQLEARHALENSLSLLNAAVAVKPDSAEAIESIGYAYLIFGEWDEVENAIRKLYSLKSPLAFDLSARIEELQKQARNEIRYLTRVHHFRKKDAQVCYNIANGYLYLKEFQNAVLWFKKSIDLKKDNAPAYRNLAMIYTRDKNYDEAIQAFKQAIRFTKNDEPDMVGLFCGLGNSLLNVSMTDAAIEAFETALRCGNELLVKPTTEMAYSSYGLGVALLQMERSIETRLLGKPLYQRLDAIEQSLFSKSPKSRRYDIIIQSFKSAIELKPDFAEAYLTLGVAYQGIGDARNATYAYREVVRLKPDYAEAYNALAIAYAEQGYFESAASTLESAIRLKPDFIEAYTSLGRVYERLDRFRDALNCYKKILEIDEQNADAHFHAGLIYVRLKDFFLATRHYNSLKRLSPMLASRLYVAIQDPLK